MSNPIAIRETTVDGPRTRLWRLRANACPALLAHHISNVGIVHAATPFARVREHPDGSFLLACFAGQGRILLDGRWQTCGAGMVCVAPPGVLNAFYVCAGKHWSFVWVRYHEPPPLLPVVTAHSPVRVRANPEPLRLAIEGLRQESNTAAEPRMFHHWVELIHAHVVRIARPQHGDPRVRALWEEVGRSLASNWSLDALAARAHISIEQLRRLCLREFGRSPMHQLTYMRMQRAATLLETTHDKLETIAPVVGYSDAIAFSKVFKKWIGSPPSEYRAGRRAKSTRKIK